jgi:hypothetical protein
MFESKCYMNMPPLYQPQVPQTEAVAWSNVMWWNGCQATPGIDPFAT